jgi:hypothetical protein
MTDTAQPLPDEIEPVGDSELTPQQRRRAAALTEARFVLATNGGLFGGQKLGEHFTVQDLLTVGDWILAEGPFATLEQVGALPISQADADSVWAAPAPDGGLPPGELPLGGLEQSSALDDPEPHQGISIEPEDDDTDVLPTYPEDALPR